MHIRPPQPTVKAPAETFTGDAWFDVIAEGRGAVAGSRQRRPVRAGRPERLARPCRRPDAPRDGGRRPDPGPRRRRPRDPRRRHGPHAARRMALARRRARPLHDPHRHLGGARRGPREPSGATWSATRSTAQPGRTSRHERMDPGRARSDRRAEEIQLASRRADGSLRRFVTIWVVRSGDDIYVRSAYGLREHLVRTCQAAGEGRIRAGGWSAT